MVIISRPFQFDTLLCNDMLAIMALSSVFIQHKDRLTENTANVLHVSQPANLQY
jgi:hypothetical protein